MLARRPFDCNPSFLLSIFSRRSSAESEEMYTGVYRSFQGQPVWNSRDKVSRLMMKRRGFIQSLMGSYMDLETVTEGIVDLNFTA